MRRAACPQVTLGAFEAAFSGIDTSVIVAVVKNLRNGATSDCPVGYRGHPRNPGPKLTDLVLRRNGHVGWIGESWQCLPPSFTPTYTRRVGACAMKAGREVESIELESGSGIALAVRRARIGP
jgi:hypothetical protein